jgi:hypothetical protein
MRIACVHVPQFALQCLTRIDPSLRGAAVAVVGGGSGSTAAGRSALLHGPIVLACSRAAWALGVRLGMTATAVNGLAPGQLRVVTADAALERETVRAIADALLGASGLVDVGGRVGAGGAHLALYCEVPSKTRGTSYGDRLVEVLAALGLSGRIGIADDRFTAWVAASHAGERAHAEDVGVTSVPRGGSAAFLAPRPLSLLSITPEVQHMLEALGIRTLGEFAALPAPSVARPLEADYQALARGDGGQTLRAYGPEAPIREQITITSTLNTSAAIALLADRIALRLTGRGRGAARLELTVGAASGERVVPIDALMSATAQLAGTGRVLDTAEELAEAISHAVGEERDAWRLAVAVIGEAVAGDPNVLAPAASQATSDATNETLAVVLSSTGSTTAAAWQLTSPSSASTLRNERRDAHRRPRRGKQHRRTSAAGVLQPKLFADRRS